MTKETLTERDIDWLLNQPKRLLLRRVKRVGNRLTAPVVFSGIKHFLLRVFRREPRFFLYLRVDFQKDFSCGLRVDFVDGNKMSLMRCDGWHKYPHFNPIEGEHINGPHIHKATMRYIKKHDRSDDCFAIPADKLYHDINGALQCLLSWCRIDVGKGGQDMNVMETVPCAETRPMDTNRYYGNGDPLNIVAKNEPDGSLTLTDEGIATWHFIVYGVSVDLPVYLKRYKSRGINVELKNDCIVMHNVPSESNKFTQAVEKFADVLEDVDYLAFSSPIVFSTKESLLSRLRAFFMGLHMEKKTI